MMDERMTESERTALCRRIDELCAENERLRQENQSIGVAAYELGRKSMADENAKLREELAAAPKCDACEAMLDCDECLRADGSHKERRRLSAENAKLRELIKDLHVAPCCGEYCWMKLSDRMRELGVVVDDG